MWRYLRGARAYTTPTPHENVHRSHACLSLSPPGHAGRQTLRPFPPKAHPPARSTVAVCQIRPHPPLRSAPLPAQYSPIHFRAHHEAGSSRAVSASLRYPALGPPGAGKRRNIRRPSQLFPPIEHGARASQIPDRRSGRRCLPIGRLRAERAGAADPATDKRRLLRVWLLAGLRRNRVAEDRR